MGKHDNSNAANVVCTWLTLVFVFAQDELMAELEELEQEELDKGLLEIEGDVPLPSVPSTSLPSRPGMTWHGITLHLLSGYGYSLVQI